MFRSFDSVHSISKFQVRLVSAETKNLIKEWSPPGDRIISVTGCNESQIVCAAGPILFYLEVKDGDLVLAGDTTLEHEVACIDITPLKDSDNRSDIVSVGLWMDITVRLLKLPNLEEITKEALGGEIIPRSILMAQFEGSTSLTFCAS